MMETIKELIKILFEKAEYECVEQSNILLYRHKRYSDFWIIVDELNIDKQIELFNKMSKYRVQFVDMEKNSTVLVLNNENAEYKLNAGQCIELENDPCFFKKNVLSYNPKTVNKLTKSLDAKSGQNLKDFLFDETSFEKVIDGDDVALLAYNIAQKLPFILLDVKAQENECECESFYNKIDKNDRNLVDEIFELKSDDAINEYIEKELLCKEEDNEI
ncbi:ABC-three component system middle component 1 [uncultured Fibrobacter sp.]|uniref:ABC-three component system middle component 1 n=1 Tax=uncultured Fibrobacter sp. TaxID=261512 RepID=UPI0025E42B00|nr:ABC-three component system middle component 1 [uncultured Fibrobacter sp.]